MAWIKDALGAFWMARWIKKTHPESQVAMSTREEWEALETSLNRAEADKRLMMQALDSVIREKKTPCDFCEDSPECKRRSHNGKGCTEWMLRELRVSELNRIGVKPNEYELSREQAWTDYEKLLEGDKDDDAGKGSGSGEEGQPVPGAVDGADADQSAGSGTDVQPDGE